MFFATVNMPTRTPRRKLRCKSLLKVTAGSLGQVDGRPRSTVRGVVCSTTGSLFGILLRDIPPVSVKVYSGGVPPREVDYL